MKEVTLCYLIDENERKILLARKNDKIGKGMWNGPGGKVESGDPSIKLRSALETSQELGVSVHPSDMEKVAEIVFVFPTSVRKLRPKRWRMHVFLLRQWSGTPVSTREMSDPTWFSYDDIPYEGMMPIDKEFLPYILAGEKLRGKALFLDDEGTVIKFSEWRGVEKF